MLLVTGFPKLLARRIANALAPRGPVVLPGTYTLRLEVDGQTATAPIQVVLDPRTKTSPAGLEQLLSLQLKVRDRILDSLPWRGDEQVLDVGCGRGLLLIGAAKRLKTGKATGVDIWQSQDLSGNSAEATKANAVAEGVADKIKLETTDARKLPFGANSFHIVVSSLAIHNIDSSAERLKHGDVEW